MVKNNIFCYCTELEKFYFSPIFTLNVSQGYSDFLNIYAFIGKEDDWEDFSNPPVIDKTIYSSKKLLKNIIYTKKLNINDINPVAERIDWKPNTFYYTYNDTTSIAERNENGKFIYPFYVRNKYDQVFKCLGNNINVANTKSISNIISHSTYLEIQHSVSTTPTTFDIGSYITIQDVTPSEYNGTYIVISSAYGIANVALSNTAYFAARTTLPYIENTGTIKPTVVTQEEPLFDVGTFDETGIVVTSDGYKWKYLYTIDRAAKLKFFDENWMPVPVDTENKNPYSTTSGWGSIDVINVVNPGNGYENGTGTVDINISGDGTGFSAESYVLDNKIQNITVTNSGKDYTYATISLTPASGFSGANGAVSFSISPIGGHGFSVIRDLFCRNLIATAIFTKDENGTLPTNFNFNQVGLIYNPYTLSDLNNHTDDSSLSFITQLIVSSGYSSFIEGEYIYQGISINDFTFKAKVLYFDEINNILYVYKTEGTPSGTDVYGETSLISRTITQITSPIVISNSGNIFYAENRIPIQRDPLGSEQIRILLSY